MESFIQLPIDGVGKKTRTRRAVIDGQEVHQQVVQIAGADNSIVNMAREDGNLATLVSRMDIKFSELADVLKDIDIVISPLIGLKNIAGDQINPSTLEQITDVQAKLQSIRDQLNVLLSTRASETTLTQIRDRLGVVEARLQVLIEKNQAQETGGNLAAIKLNSDRLNVSLSTRASELTLNGLLEELRQKTEPADTQNVSVINQLDISNLATETGVLAASLAVLNDIKASLAVLNDIKTNTDPLKNVSGTIMYDNQLAGFIMQVQ